MTDRNRSVNSRPTGWLGALFGTRVPGALVALTGILVGLGAVFYAMGYVTRPWARSLTGRALLIGYWQGEAIYQPGDRRGIVLYLSEYRGARQASPVNLAGTAKACSPRDNTRYSVVGRVRDRRGAQFTLNLSPDSTEASLHPGEIEGRWDGQDGLSLHARLYLRARNAARGEVSASARDASGPVRFELRRSGREAFEAACSSPGHR
jgi:hypothetical protein